MHYMLLIYQQEGAEAATPQQTAQAMEAHWAVIEETTRLGILQGVSPLEPTSAATTIRVKNGQKVVLDGPFAETKEHLAGYYILDCQNLDEAIAWAKRLPLQCSGGEGSIEIRPLKALPQKSDFATPVDYATAHNG